MKYIQMWDDNHIYNGKSIHVYTFVIRLTIMFNLRVLFFFTILDVLMTSPSNTS